MKKLFILSISIVLLAGCARHPKNDVLAEVDHEKIYREDLQRAFAQQKENYGMDLLNDPLGNFTVKRNLMNGLIEEKLLLSVVHEKGISLTSEEKELIKSQLESGYNEGDLRKILSSQKMTPEDWLKQQEEKQMVDKAIDQELKAQLVLKPGEVEDYYKKHASLFREPDGVRCRHIVVTKEEKAKTILSLLKKGENFANVARQYSESPDREQDGDLGLLNQNSDFPSVFKETCLTLKTGQTSEIVSSEYGYHIFRAIEKKEGHQLTLPEAKGKIEAFIRQERRPELLATWLETLHQTKKIHVDEERLKEVRLSPL
ncbi:MAG: peptidyl-prolyl cis-trans isomerase [Deltaproteobacteria bacterium]|nr:peptidyl-prolyl cis-trans isomerase [Deltaproteobacteria bacterium]